METLPPSATIDQLGSHGLFGFFDKAFIDHVMALGRPLSLRPGEILFHADELGDQAFILLEGMLEVMVAIGHEQIRVAMLEPVQVVGEIAIFANQPRIATVIARAECRLISLSRDQWISLVASHPSAGHAIIADLGRRLASVNRPLAFLSTATQLLQNDRVDGETLANMAQDVGNLGPFAAIFATMVREIRAKQERQQDMAVARAIQESVLPKRLDLPAELIRIHGLIRPMKEVGGDLYDYFMVDEKHLAITVADVSGKGVPASLFMMMFRTVLRAVTIPGMGPHLVLARANDLLAQDNDACMFVTAFFALLDLQSGLLTYANAGHNPPFLLRQAGGCERLAHHGKAVGIVENARYQPIEIALEPGDRLFLFTDGVTEAFAPDRQQYGDQRLERLLTASRGTDMVAWVAEVIHSVDRFANGAEQSDDITCLAVAYRPDGQNAA